MNAPLDSESQTGARIADYLDGQRTAAAPKSLAPAILALSRAAASVSTLISRGPLSGTPGNDGDAGATAEARARTESLANAIFLEALADTATAYYASTTEEAIQTLDPRGDLAIAVHPLEAAANLEGDGCAGALFAIFPASPAGATASFLRPGEQLLAAGYVVFGPHTAMTLSLRDGVDVFALDHDSRTFRLAAEGVRIPAETREFAINIANYRHWHHPVRLFVDDCLAGQNGPRGHDHDMRWTASLVGEAHRILCRGGVFLAPADHRPGGSCGRLRLIHEAMPIAFIVEQAGGAATEGHHRILGLTPVDFEQLTPLVFGSATKVEMVGDYHLGGPSRLGDAPLFGRRGLYRK
jgi:fructose-1,6-bisphosphatase I